MMLCSHTVETVKTGICPIRQVFMNSIKSLSILYIYHQLCNLAHCLNWVIYSVTRSAGLDSLVYLDCLAMFNIIDNIASESDPHCVVHWFFILYRCAVQACSESPEERPGPSCKCTCKCDAVSL